MERTERMEMTEAQDRGDRIQVKIVEHIGVLSESKGWKKELNIVSWNQMPAKFDIREWDEYHEHMKKGITFTKSEIRELRNILADVDLQMVEVPKAKSRRKKEEPLTATEEQAVGEGFVQHVPF